MTNPAIPILRAAMKQRNLTVAGVAIRSGLSRSTVSRLLNGKQRFNARTWLKLSYPLGEGVVGTAIAADIKHALEQARKDLT